MVYDYRCKSCGKKFWIEAPMGRKIRNGKHPGTPCPHCKSRNVKKLIHKAEIIFKGSGFYSTDKGK